MEKNIHQEIIKAFEIVFKGSDVETLRRGTHPWDSLKHLELLNVIEVNLSIRLSIAQAVRIDSLAAALREASQPA